MKSMNFAISILISLVLGIYHVILDNEFFKLGLFHSIYCGVTRTGLTLFSPHHNFICEVE